MELNKHKNSSIDVNKSVVCSVSLEISTKSADDIKPQCDDSGYHSWSNADCSSDVYECDDRTPRSKQVTMQSDYYRDNEASLLKNNQFVRAGLHRGRDSDGLACQGTTCTASPARVTSSTPTHSACIRQGNVVGNENHIKHYDPQFRKPHATCVSCSASVEICATASIHYANGHNNISYEETLINNDPSHVPYESTNCHTIQHDSVAKDTYNSEAHELAIKIDFCLMFGYTAEQIHAAITKLTYRASKNDILAELSSVQYSSIAFRPSTDEALGKTVDTSLSTDQYETAGETVGCLISRGTGAQTKTTDQARGPSTVTNGNKEPICTKPKEDDYQNLRPIVIDGSNVAMSHGNKQFFSCKGILLAVDFFRNRNHRDVTVFVPTYRKESPRPDAPIRDREILDKLEKERILVYTPSRCINGRRVTCYDDRFILKLAQETGGVIVSNDNFRDLQNEKPEWKELIEKRLLMYSFVSDRFMPPDDPLGRNGPSIDNFLRCRPASEEQTKPQCPYGKKCTYGKKCKYFHPECAISVTDTLKEKADKRVKVSSEATRLATTLIAEERDSVGKNRLPYLSANNPNSGLDASMAGRKQISSGDGSHGHCQTKLSSIPHEPSAVYHQFKNKRDDLSKSFNQLNMSDERSQAGQCRKSNNCMCYECTCRSYNHSRPPQYNIPLPHHPYPDIIPSMEVQKKSVINQSGHHFQPSLPVIPHHVPYQHPQQQHMPHSYLPPSHLYPNNYTDPQYPPNHPQQVMYPYSMPNNPSQPMPHNMLHNPGQYYLPPYNHTSGSDNSLSHSYPFVASPDQSLYAPVPHHNMSSPNCNSDPKTFPPRTTRRVYSSPGHHHPQMRVHPAPSYTNGDSSHTPSYPLSHVKNSRHHLFQNLCGLFKRDVVEKVMTSHPNITEPKAIIAMCLKLSE